MGSAEALKFLLTEAKLQKKQGKDIYPILAGLKYSGKVIVQEEIIWLLDQKLNREEFISVSHLKAEFLHKDLIFLYKQGKRKRAYTVEYIFRNPVDNFESLKWIVDKEFENKNYQTILQWMMSDSIQGNNNLKVKELREKAIRRAKEQKRAKF